MENFHNSVHAITLQQTMFLLGFSAQMSPGLPVLEYNSESCSEKLPHATSSTRWDQINMAAKPLYSQLSNYTWACMNGDNL